MMHGEWFSWGPGGGFGRMWLGPLIWIIILGVAIWAAISLKSRGTGGSRPGPRESKTAREILDERFAKGEIDEDEYRRRRDTLDS